MSKTFASEDYKLDFDGHFCHEGCHHDKAILNEMVIQDVLTYFNPNDLPHRDYSYLIPFVKYVGRKNDIFKFFVPNKYNGWNTYLQFLEWDQVVNDMSLTAPEAARMLVWVGNVRYHCPCPAFKFWGHSYQSTMLDLSIIPQTIPAPIRDPNGKGLVCKHLIVMLRVSKFHTGTIAKEIAQLRKERGLR